MICKYCRGKAYGTEGLCRACQEKINALRKSTVFNKGKPKKAKLISERNISLEPTDTYKNKNHKIGSDTKKLIDFVNKSGTIHYGRYVAGMIEKER